MIKLMVPFSGVPQYRLNWMLALVCYRCHHDAAQTARQNTLRIQLLTVKDYSHSNSIILIILKRLLSHLVTCDVFVITHSKYSLHIFPCILFSSYFSRYMHATVKPYIAFANLNIKDIEGKIATACRPHRVKI